MMDARRQKRRAFWQLFGIFFLLIAFVLTSSMFLFMNFLERDTGVKFTLNNIRLAAIVTFGNVFMLSLFCTLTDILRRKHTVERPVKRILDGAEQVMNGDLTVQIEHVRGAETGFNVIIDYFNRMIRELKGIETLRTDFISNVSHELKTPLAVIQNYSTLLQQPELSEETRLDYARTITGAARRLTDLITNILKLNKLENQQIYPK